MKAMKPVTKSPQWQTAVSRSLIYSFLSRAVAYPSPEHQTVMREQIAPALGGLDGDEGVPSGLREALRLVDRPLDEMREAHAAIFTMTVSADCPDYETAYNCRDVFQQAHAMADVAGFYRAHGLNVGGRQYERPDHITTELEFMGFLALKEAYALEKLGSENVEMAREAQALFLKEHLGCWGPALGRRIEAQAESDTFFASAGKALAAWLMDDCERLGVEPIRVIDEPLLAWPEMDDGSCGGEAGCPVIRFDEIPVERG